MLGKIASWNKYQAVEDGVERTWFYWSLCVLKDGHLNPVFPKSTHSPVKFLHGQLLPLHVAHGRVLIVVGHSSLYIEHEVPRPDHEHLRWRLGEAGGDERGHGELLLSRVVF